MSHNAQSSAISKLLLFVCVCKGDNLLAKAHELSSCMLTYAY